MTYTGTRTWTRTTHTTTTTRACSTSPITGRCGHRPHTRPLTLTHDSLPMHVILTLTYNPSPAQGLRGRHVSVHRRAEHGAAPAMPGRGPIGRTYPLGVACLTPPSHPSPPIQSMGAPKSCAQFQAANMCDRGATPALTHSLTHSLTRARTHAHTSPVTSDLVIAPPTRHFLVCVRSHHQGRQGLGLLPQGARASYSFPPRHHSTSSPLKVCGKCHGEVDEEALTTPEHSMHVIEPMRGNRAL